MSDKNDFRHIGQDGECNVVLRHVFISYRSHDYLTGYGYTSSKLLRHLWEFQVECVGMEGIEYPGPMQSLFKHLFNDESTPTLSMLINSLAKHNDDNELTYEGKRSLNTGEWLDHPQLNGFLASVGSGVIFNLEPSLTSCDFNGFMLVVKKPINSANTVSPGTRGSISTPGEYLDRRRKCISKKVSNSDGILTEVDPCEATKDDLIALAKGIKEIHRLPLREAVWLNQVVDEDLHGAIRAGVFYRLRELIRTSQGSNYSVNLANDEQCASNRIQRYESERKLLMITCARQSVSAIGEQATRILQETLWRHIDRSTRITAPSTYSNVTQDNWSAFRNALKVGMYVPRDKSVTRSLHSREEQIHDLDVYTSPLHPHERQQLRSGQVGDFRVFNCVLYLLHAIRGLMSELLPVTGWVQKRTHPTMVDPCALVLDTRVRGGDARVINTPGDGQQGGFVLDHDPKRAVVKVTVRRPAGDQVQIDARQVFSRRSCGDLGRQFLDCIGLPFGARRYRGARYIDFGARHRPSLPDSDSEVIDPELELDYGLGGSFDVDQETKFEFHDDDVKLWNTDCPPLNDAVFSRCESAALLGLWVRKVRRSYWCLGFQPKPLGDYLELLAEDSGQCLNDGLEWLSAVCPADRKYEQDELILHLSLRVGLTRREVLVCNRIGFAIRSGCTTLLQMLKDCGVEKSAGRILDECELIMGGLHDYLQHEDRSLLREQEGVILSFCETRESNPLSIG